MGRSVNKAQLIGCLGKDPEVSHLPNGNAVANVSLATDESYNDKQTGQKVEQTEWHRLTVYGKLAEVFGQYLRKGSKIWVEGKLKTREWEKDGVKRYTTEIIVNEMTMLDSKQDSQSQQGGYQQPQQSYQQHPQQYQQNPGYSQQPAQNYQQPSTPPQNQPQGAYQAHEPRCSNQGAR